MSKETFIEKQEENLSIHIFSVSSAMVGVCLTVIGIFALVCSYNKIQTAGDDITAVDAIFFLSACILSYIAMKTKEAKRRLFLEKAADIIFLIGLSLMASICFFIVYILSQQMGK